MDHDKRFWKAGTAIINVSKISFISPFDMRKDEFTIVIDGSLVNINSNRETYINFIKRFTNEFTIS